MSLPFKYSTNEFPSLPLIDIKVSNAFGTSCPEKGKIDTGSSRTVIPIGLIKKLKLNATGKTMAGGFNTKPKPYDTYHVSITVGSNEFGLLKVIAEEKPYVLLGRDLINLWTLTLDGENIEGEIIHWTTDPSKVQ